MHIRIVAVGKKAEQESSLALDMLEISNPDAILSYDLQPLGGMSYAQASRCYKTTAPSRAHGNTEIYLDADTRVAGDLSPLVQMLEDGWDLVITPSQHQGDECFWHVDDIERETTFSEIGYIPLQLQCGVMAYQINDRIHEFFSIWHDEWLRWKDEDQAAFMRALNEVPLKIWLLGRPWNGGAVVGHNHGRCRD